MQQFLLIAGAPLWPPFGIWVGPIALIVIAFIVVWLSGKFHNPYGLRSRPDDYDNRWPGYPLHPGQYGYDPLYKGPMGNLHEAKFETGIDKWINNYS